MADNDNHVVLPNAEEMAAAERIVNSPPVIGQFASCEWDELTEDGHVWVAAIVREARRG
jgi:hypothetical protein